MQGTKLKDLKRGEWFTRKPIEYPRDAQVWVRGDYDRSSKRYNCTSYDDINRELNLRGDTVVYTDFIF